MRLRIDILGLFFFGGIMDRKEATFNVIHARHAIHFGETARFMPNIDRLNIPRRAVEHMKHKPYATDFGKVSVSED